MSDLQPLAIKEDKRVNNHLEDVTASDVGRKGCKINTRVSHVS